MHDESIIVPLTQGKVAIIDAEDAERVLAHRWHAIFIKGYWYARKSDGVYMHRLILGTPKGMLTDHADNDGLNNRKTNLRPCTKTQNQANSPRHKRGVSGYRGVWKSRHGDKWIARIKHHRVTVGPFTDAREAARAYDAVARAVWGEFAVLNFPDE